MVSERLSCICEGRDWLRVETEIPITFIVNVNEQLKASLRRVNLLK
jgi:hypothetical protein